jgi:hypothetical protein
MTSALPARVLAHATLLAALLASACGVGVGGTGSGESAFEVFAASPAPVCGASIADALRCPAGPGAALGTATVYLAEATPASRVLATVLGDEIEIQLRCSGQRFAGRWGVAPVLGARYYGELFDADGRSTPVSVMVQLDGEALVFTLQRREGSTAAGPLTLREVPGPTTPAVC